ncbi:MAG: nicotinate-nucleotide adenylyltransferase [Coxiellaceae bacterium]|nr:nicotinate-nucleotide adenylyltransferase [Coxiellaceae bacterium]
MQSKAVGLLGGTFDPIHEGHLSIAKQVYHALPLERVDFIPCFQPPHRNQPDTSANDRLAMVKLAIQDFPYFSANPIEIVSQKISYTIDTLKQLRKENPSQAFCFIIGSDAFSQFHKWHDCEKIVELVHLIVVSREHQQLPQSISLQKLLRDNETKNSNDLHALPAGKIYFQTITPINISATAIRHALKNHEKKIPGLPKAVEIYIQEFGLYKSL